MTDREKLLAKIHALLAKTIEQGCTEEEALAALAKARGMMDAYEVTEADLQLTKTETAILRSEPPGSRDPHKIKTYLASAVARFFDCRGADPMDERREARPSAAAPRTKNATQSADGVATSREGRRSPRSSPAVRHRRWGREPLRVHCQPRH
jgi:hypothetical protein